jgi:hypothetical protein
LGLFEKVVLAQLEHVHGRMVSYSQGNCFEPADKLVEHESVAILLSSSTNISVVEGRVLTQHALFKRPKGLSQADWPLTTL